MLNEGKYDFTIKYLVIDKFSLPQIYILGDMRAGL